MDNQKQEQTPKQEQILIQIDELKKQKTDLEDQRKNIESQLFKINYQIDNLNSKNNLIRLYTIVRQWKDYDFSYLEQNGLFITRESAEKYLLEKFNDNAKYRICTTHIPSDWDGKENPNWQSTWRC